MIVGVAGFGILAIFSMIVAEKTRDIGILKSLGASNGGVMKIFLGYGLLLGVVGAGCWARSWACRSRTTSTRSRRPDKVTGAGVHRRACTTSTRSRREIESLTVTAGRRRGGR